ncbi:MAG: ATP-binding protein [Planctomycetia bacterium]|nr:ATP-binding protein [Planctomycetia bacterium]
MSKKLHIIGLPKNEEYDSENSFLRSIFIKYLNKYFTKTKIDNLNMLVYTSDSDSEHDALVREKQLEIQISKLFSTTKDHHQSDSSSEHSDENDFEKRATQYKGEKPFYTFERLIVNDEVLGEIMRSLTLFSHHDLMYHDWGLSEIDPFPAVALNFYGPSGTGKTLAAHAIADYLNKNIIIASYAQIESMYHGEGPKNVESLFFAAERDNAVLFIDEADSLLSRRLTNVTQGSEQAINSMRSQLLICLEKFHGIVIFATNLSENYDKAFETRIRSIHFSMPDELCRKRIWDKHIPSRFPIDENITREHLTDLLAQKDDFCGRDIRNAIKSVAEDLVTSERERAQIEDFYEAIERVRSRRLKDAPNAEGKELPLNDEQKGLLTELIQDKISDEETIAPNESNIAV